MHVGQEAARLAREGLLHQLAVHHHQRLGDRPLEARRFLGLVVGEGEEELPQPGVALAVAVVAAAGLDGPSSPSAASRRAAPGVIGLSCIEAEERPRPSRSPSSRTLLSWYARLAMIQRQSFLTSYPLSLEVLGELVEQLGVAGRVVRAEVVDRIDEAPAEEVGPHPIDERLGEHLVLRVGDQLAQLGPADHVVALADLPAVEEPREGDPDHAVAPVEPRRNASVGSSRSSVWSYDLAARWRRPASLSSVFIPLKKALIPQKSACFQSFDGWSWHWVHWICWPRNSRVVREVSGTALELEVGQDEVDRAVLLVRARGRDQVMDDLVPGPVRRANCFRSQLVSAARSTIRPWLPRPISRTVHWVAKFLAIVGMIEQVLDQLLALVGLPRVDRNARASWTLGIRPSRSR